MTNTSFPPFLSPFQVAPGKTELLRAEPLIYICVYIYMYIYICIYIYIYIYIYI